MSQFMSEEEAQRFAKLMGWSEQDLRRAQLAVLSGRLDQLQARLGLPAAPAVQAKRDADAADLRRSFGLTEAQWNAAGNRSASR